MATAPFLSDLVKVRDRTRRHLAEGSAAAGVPRSRSKVLRLLNDILASELMWLMRYRRRYLLSSGQPRIAEERERREPSPADGLVRRIVQLGGEPDLDPDHLLSRSLGDYASRGSVADMIREDLRAERIVIESYAEVIGYIGDSDPPTREVLETNLDRESTRAEQLSQLLRDLDAH